MIHRAGGGTGRYALTLRLPAGEGNEAALCQYLATLSDAFASAPGGVACHLLRTETPKIAGTTEQQIRGGRDAVADWVVVATGYTRAVLEILQRGKLGHRLS